MLRARRAYQEYQDIYGINIIRASEHNIRARKQQLLDAKFVSNYQGQHVSLGVALDFIMHLRFIGGEFRKQFLNDMTSDQLSLATKEQILQRTMALIMPPELATEAKLPLTFPLDLPCLQISYAMHRPNLKVKEKLWLSPLNINETLRTIMTENHAAPHDTPYYCPILTALEFAVINNYGYILKLLLSAIIRDGTAALCCDDDHPEYKEQWLSTFKLIQHKNLAPMLQSVKRAKI